MEDEDDKIDYGATEDDDDIADLEDELDDDDDFALDI